MPDKVNGVYSEKELKEKLKAYEPHAHWVWIRDEVSRTSDKFYCSNCEHVIEIWMGFGARNAYPKCPKCQAIMDEKEKERGMSDAEIY